MRRSRTWRHERTTPGKGRGFPPEPGAAEHPGTSSSPRELSAGPKRSMWGVSCVLMGCLLILDLAAADLLYRPGRRICSSGGHTGFVSVTQSYVQPAHKPVITMCEGHRVCSTYRTTYKISYRQVSKKTSLPLYTCCPGWRRMNVHSCDNVSCRLLCQNGGTCVGYNRCQCTEGWSGNHCQTDVDECESGQQRCSQSCTNTHGSFRCGCYEGFSLSSDGKSCHKVEKVTTASPPPAQSSANGTVETEIMRQEMLELRSKIEVLEQKLQLVLAPFHSLSTVSPEDGLGPVTFLTHSFQQLDRIDSLSEQISFLEERLETCSCKNDL
ncbi:epidermal growth factor-like protein 7 isoform X1 [Ranitomeya variabilis]|uniref:epidermal growth factor-like protein 7 isoform X1 n=2 Tax=Ranitomeya variabilis TaxID=490064 RepID=UPI004056D394